MTIALALALTAALAPRPQGDPLADWSEDVMQLVEALERMHPDPFAGCPQADFEEGVDEFLGGLEGASEAKTTVELMRLMARLSRGGREGHAVVWPMASKSLPLSLYSFDDGWFVVDASSAQREWLGARVVSVGGVPLEEACKRLAPLLTRDNDWNLRDKLANALGCVDVLVGSGVCADPEHMTVELERDGARKTLVLAAEPAHPHLAFPLPQRKDELWLAGHDKAFAWQVLEPEHALYVQFNEVTAADASGRTLADFAAEVVRTFEERKLARLIVDVRANGGGDNTTFGPLIQALQSPTIDRPGVLFGLIGRHTFSAAGNFVTVLQRDTKAILLGEPTGGAPNQYGDARNVQLPHHPGILVRIATRYHSFGGPDDKRLTHEPNLLVPLRSADYFAGRDPVLRAALDYQPPK